MSLWLIRSGTHGEYETHFLDKKRVYFQWESLSHDLGTVADQDAMFAVMKEFYPDNGDDRLWNWARQAWAFAKRMEVGHWVVMPSKLKRAIHVGQITGRYEYHPDGADRMMHSRTVDWIATDIPRSNFDQDLLYSFGAFLTVCQISRNDAEARIKAMAANGWKTTIFSRPVATATATDETASAAADIEEAARDNIAALIIARFKGHGLARLIDALLRAQGYTTHLSKEGPDQGVDILAAPDALGFGSPRICVQVKSDDAAADRPTLDQLIGTMQNFHADQGLLVSWSGFKSSVDKEIPRQFFKVRLWGQEDIIEQLLANYEKLDPDIRAELPLKRIWTVAHAEGQ